MNLGWEKIAWQTWRLKVFGGWVVNCVGTSTETETSVFVPDANHEWSIDECT